MRTKASAIDFDILAKMRNSIDRNDLLIRLTFQVQQTKTKKKKKLWRLELHGEIHSLTNSLSNSTMIPNSIFKIIFFFIVIFIIIPANGNGFDASVFGKLRFRKLAAHTPIHIAPQMSPSSAPVSSVEIATTDERCPILQTRNCNNLNKVTACFRSSASGSGGASKELFLLLQNDGEGPVEINVTISNLGVTFPLIQLAQHQAKKINIPVNAEGSPSIILNARNGKCIMHLGSSELEGKFYEQFSSVSNYLAPIHGAYLFFLTALIVGGAWTCCKLGKSERQVNGVRYQELEMEQPDSDSADNVKAAQGWDQGWDDEWEEMKSPSRHSTGNGSATGLASRTANPDGWENDWDD